MIIRRAWRTLLGAAGVVTTCGGYVLAQVTTRSVQARAGAPDSVDVHALPLIEMPGVRGASRTPPTFAVFLSGDGGWATLDRDVAAALAHAGVGVVGFNSRAYLSARRTPDDVSHDLARIVRHYEQVWGAHRVVLVGYSRGAEMLPFAITRLPTNIRSHVALLAMFSLSTAASFEFHWMDLVKTVHRNTDVPVQPELAKLRGLRMLCVYGVEETDSGCRVADSTLVTKLRRPGGHHFDNNYPALAALILHELTPPARRSSR